MIAWLIRRLRAERPGPEEHLEPPAGADPRLPVHVVAEEAELRIEDGMLHIGSTAGERALRLEEISLVALHGAATVTTPCLAALARAGVPVLFLSRSGHYEAQLVSLSTNHTAVRRAHYRAAADRVVTLRLARELVEAKIANARRLLRRRFGAGERSVSRLGRQLRAVRRARSLEALRGVEGAAAAVYWAAWPGLLRADDDLFVFDGRSRRPPRDAVNALLSYLYAVTCGTCAAAALGAGLDPHVGFLHAERPGRPALALDLAEPLRSAVVDAAVIAAINRGAFGPEDFAAQPDGSVRLSDAGRRLALGILERRLSTVLDYAGAELTWRAAIDRHAQLIAARLTGRRRGAPAPRLG